MTKIYFAYDGEVGKQETSHWRLNVYDNKYYPTNGTWEDCYYDYHAPLQTVFENNGISTESITMHEALGSDKPFVYVLTFRTLSNVVLNHHLKNGIKGIPASYNFFEHLPYGLIKAINNNQCILILNDAHESNNYSEKYYSFLKDKLNRASINFNNVLLLSGNAGNDIVDQNIKMIKWQYFETAMRLTFSNVRPIGRTKENSKLKKFLCLNRTPREIRYYFMYQLWSKNIIKDCNASLKDIKDLKEIRPYNDNYDFIDQIKDIPEFKNMMSTLPWVLDTSEFNNNHWNRIDSDFAKNNLIFVTTETLFYPDTKNLFLTEKTYKPIAMGMPFIVIGNPTILRYLRSFGYKTFNSLWDESYDEELDCYKRISKIINLIEDISKKYTNDQLFDLIEEHRHIMEHNYNLFMERRPEQQVINYLKERLHNG